MEETVEIPVSAATRSPACDSTILILEDETEFANLIAEFLHEIGCTVKAVSNGVDGLKMLLEQKFDAILCDMMMPKMSGDLFYLATERVRPELCPRFIFMTGHVSNPKIDYFIQAIGGTLLTKPFTMSAMLASIEYVLHEAKIRKALKPGAGRR